ncbi:MAG: DUF3267 domain-containing protein [Ruminococcus sp.]|nr:DUF3267 domain-containing protein [Ruminococcus sp.]
MKFHYAGKYNGDENSLPQREHPANSVPFREPQNMKMFSVIMNILAGIIVILFLLIASAVSEKGIFSLAGELGILCFIITMIPHEFLHAVCFKDDIFMYQNLKQGMLFVVGTEDMSKSRFILMCLLPNIIFGIVPFIIFLIFPDMIFLGTLGAMAISGGAGDYLNVFNCLTQVPNGAKVYMSGMHTYWHK